MKLMRLNKMTNDIMHTIQLEKLDGFDLLVNFLIEYTPYGDTCDETPEDLKAIYEKIDNYDYVYFCAQVVASKNGIELGSDYLGCCLYNSYEDFITDNDCISDMKNIAVEQAKIAIAGLTS